MWIMGFGTRRMLGDLVTPEYLLLFRMQGSPQTKVLLGGRDWQLTSLFCE